MSWGTTTLSCELFTQVLRSRLCCKKHCTEYKHLVQALHGYPNLTAEGQGSQCYGDRKWTEKVRIPFLSQNLKNHKQTQEFWGVSIELNDERVWPLYNCDRASTTAPKCPIGWRKKWMTCLRFDVVSLTPSLVKGHLCNKRSELKNYWKLTNENLFLSRTASAGIN